MWSLWTLISKKQRNEDTLNTYEGPPPLRTQSWHRFSFKACRVDIDLCVSAVPRNSVFLTSVFSVHSKNNLYPLTPTPHPSPPPSLFPASMPVACVVNIESDTHSEHRFPAPSSLKEGCRKPVLGVWVRHSLVAPQCLPKRTRYSTQKASYSCYTNFLVSSFSFSDMQRLSVSGRSVGLVEVSK